MKNRELKCGDKFGRLTILCRSKKNHDRAYYLCRCECGKEKDVRKDHLTSGITKSCGCLQKEIAGEIHGLVKTRIYRIFSSMKSRCLCNKAPYYKNYGGRGIRICSEWRNDFMTFYNWAMENGYEEHLTIDRIDNNGNYDPSNCRWITRKEQLNNKRNNRLITYNGQTNNLTQWAEILQINTKTLDNRLKNWSTEKSFNKPVNKRRSNYEC